MRLVEATPASVRRGRTGARSRRRRRGGTFALPRRTARGLRRERAGRRASRRSSRGVGGEVEGGHRRRGRRGGGGLEGAEFAWSLEVDDGRRRGDADPPRSSRPRVRAGRFADASRGRGRTRKIVRGRPLGETRRRTARRRPGRRGCRARGSPRASIRRRTKLSSSATNASALRAEPAARLLRPTEVHRTRRDERG